MERSRSRTRSIGLEVERRDEHVVPAVRVAEELDDRRGHAVRRVVVGVAGQVLHLDVDEHPGAGVERLLERRDLGPGGADLGLGSLGEHAEAAGVGVVVHDQRAVGGPVDVELDPVGAERAGGHERLQRVLGRHPGGTAMGEHARCRHPSHSATQDAGQTPCAFVQRSIPFGIASRWAARGCL